MRLVFQGGRHRGGGLRSGVGRLRLYIAGPSVNDALDTNNQMKGEVVKTALSLAFGLLVTAAVGLAAEGSLEGGFVLGPKHLSDGDEIIIEHVSATSPNFAVGDRVTVRGRY